jgi:hypothetical protein
MRFSSKSIKRVKQIRKMIKHRHITPKYRILIFCVIVCIIGALVLNHTGVLSGEPPLTVVGFDQDRAYADVRYLVDAGPRMAGTEAEYRGAEYIADEMESAGLDNVHIEDYRVLLYDVNNAEVSLVKYGPIRGILPINYGTNVIEYTHTVDYVVQGYSGSYRWQTFQDDLEIVDMGNGSDENAWDQAAGKAGIVKHEPGVSSNTVLFFKARDHNLQALILHNVEIHEELNYPPISKSTGMPDGETTYPELPFFMVSKDMGEELIERGSQEWKLRLRFDVTVEERITKVVVGDITGTEKPNKYVALGAHHDTVYNGVGAVDNTAGTATIIEIARSMSEMNLKPKRTIRFFTWGAEEEGLFGSFEYVDAHVSDVKDNCLFYQNFDMNNIDLTRGNTGWFGSNSNLTVDKYNEFIDIVQKKNPEFQKYNVTSEYSHLKFGSDQVAFLLQDVPVSFLGGSGSWEYHTYMDTIEHVNAESMALFGIVCGSYALYLANK